MTARSIYRLCFSGILCLCLWHPHVAFSASANQLSAAFDIVNVDLVNANVAGLSGTNGVLSNLGVISPLTGSSFAVLSTGIVSAADNSPGTDHYADGSPYGDIATLTISLSVPANAESLGFRFFFLSAEYPDWVGQDYNDTFTASVSGSAFSGDIAQDALGNAISVNTVYFAQNNANLAGTGFQDHGSTGWLTALVPVDPSTTVTLSFEVTDVFDGVYDSAVILDGFFWSETDIEEPSINKEECTNGVDDDDDTLIDCDDIDDCADHPACVSEICDDSIDNDNDTLIDCVDPDCFSQPYCCDDDLDGFIDMYGVCGGTDCDDTQPHLYDSDGDLWPNACDNCIFVPNSNQGDSDMDSLGDACDICPGYSDFIDTDSDGVPDGCDACAESADGVDSDADTIPDDCDNCIMNPNGNQYDSDGDGSGDVCDICPGASDFDDFDSDNTPDGCDNCPGEFNPQQADFDADGMGNVCDVCPYDADETDSDGDGDYSCTDCDDNSAFYNTYDLDGDFYSTCAMDCNDYDVSVHPGALETPNGVDEDCDGVVDEETIYYDDDGDGFTEMGGDCDDANPMIHPASIEICDGVDQDCDGVTDENTECFDDDGDGFTELDGDCNDANPNTFPGAVEIMGNGIDDNCDGITDNFAPDLDGDGFALSGGDCDDGNGHLHPGAEELPDGLDNDCDGLIDEGTINSDDDGDGFSELEGDCHDGDPSIFPNAEEVVNGIDDDCDGTVDEGSDRTDDDGDGYTEEQGDCDDTNSEAYPTNNEIPNNEIDDNCDGIIDEPIDWDGDGFTEEDGDCDDTNGWMNPDLPEVCDGVDNNCDGVIDEDCEQLVDGIIEGAHCGCSNARPSPLTHGFLLLSILSFLALRRRVLSPASS